MLTELLIGVVLSAICYYFPSVIRSKYQPFVSLKATTTTYTCTHEVRDTEYMSCSEDIKEVFDIGRGSKQQEGACFSLCAVHQLLVLNITGATLFIIRIE